MFVWILASAWLLYQAAGLCHQHGAAASAWSEHQLDKLTHHWFSPFAAGWAMARLRIPVLSVLALVSLIIAILKVRHRHIKLAVSAGLSMLVFVLLPYGVARAT